METQADKNNHLSNEQGRRYRLLFITLEVSMLISLFISVESTVSNTLGTIPLIVVTNLILLVPALSLFLMMRIRSRRLPDERIWVMLLAAALTLNLYNGLTRLPGVSSQNILETLSLSFLSVLVITTISYILLLRPALKKGRKYNYELSRDYSAKFVRSNGGKTLVFSTEKDIFPPAQSYILDDDLVVIANESFMEGLSEGEKDALFLHEAAHHLHRYKALTHISLFFLVYASYLTAYVYMGNSNLPSLISIPVLLVMLVSIPIAMRTIISYINRSEFAADNYCVSRMGSKEGIISLLDKLQEYVINRSTDSRTVKGRKEQIMQRIAHLVGDPEE